MSELGVNISRRRHQLNMTQEQLSNLTDLTINYLSKLERGKIKHIRAETLYIIAKGLNTSMEKLIDSKNNNSKNHVTGHYEQQLYSALANLDDDKIEKVSKSILDLLFTEVKNENN